MKTDSQIIGALAPKSSYPGSLLNFNKSSSDLPLSYWSYPTDNWLNDSIVDSYTYVPDVSYYGFNLQRQYAPLCNTGLNIFPISAIDPDGFETVEIGGSLVRVPRSDASFNQDFAFLDWVTFSLDVSSVSYCSLTAPYFRLNTSYPDSDVPLRLSAILFSALGFGISEKSDKGILGYKDKYHLGKDGCYGWVGMGGDSQRGRMTVSINGQGMLLIDGDGISKLKQFIDAVGGVLTRCDLSRDYFDGSYSPVHARNDYKLGLFNNHASTKVKASMAGDWVDDDAPGKTFYVGTRTSRLYVRVYHKLYQLLGDKVYSEVISDSTHHLHHLLSWSRFEIELKNKDCVIPTDILVNPGAYFAAAYPVFRNDNNDGSRLTRIKFRVKTTVERVIKNAKNQFGSTFEHLVQLYGLEGAYSKIKRSKVPRWFKDISSASTPPYSDEFIHHGRALA